MDILTLYYTQFGELLKQNPVVAGAFSLWGLTLVTYLCKNIPASIVEFASSQVTTNLTINNTGYQGNDELFKSFLAWYGKTDWVKLSRAIALEGNKWNGGGVIVGPGLGYHFFIFEGRLFWFRKENLQSSGTDKEKQQIVIRTLGRNQECFHSLIEAFRVKDDAEMISVFTFNDGWSRLTTIRKRDLSTVIINRELKNSILEKIEYFTQNREWFDSRGLPYKLTLVMHGKPGTGKTSLISALASHFDRNVCIINVGSMSDDRFELAMGSLPADSIVLIEDFDSSSAFKSRWVGNSNSSSSPKTKLSISDVAETPTVSSLSTKATETPDTWEPLTLTRVLNTLDGIVRLDDTIVVMTTNSLADIDPAVLRKGRVDWIYEIPFLQDREVRDYVLLMYGVEPDENVHFAEIAGCDLQGFFLEHKEDYDAFIAALPKL